MLLPIHTYEGLVEASHYQPSRPHTTDGGLLDRKGYIATRTSITFLHLILQDCEYFELVTLPDLLLVVLVRASFHLAVAPPLLTGLPTEQRTLLPHFVHPLGSPLVY